MSMKITMMGCSGTGKTCYLYGTYARMLDGVCGFNFNPSDWNESLSLTEAWFSLLEPSAHWPVGSNESKEYTFDIFYDGQKLGEFSWLDYRGGILNSRMDGDSKQDIQMFYNRCSNSDALIVCIPAELLLQACESGNQGLMANRMFLRYKSILMNLPNLAKTPVVLMITKGDFFSKKQQLIDGIAKLKETFNILFNQNHEAVMIVRTYLGHFSGDLKQDGLIEGCFDPKNIHLPILFPLYLDFEKQAEFLRNRGDKDARQSGWGKFWNGDRSAEHYKNAREMQQKADVIWQEFERCADIYQRGTAILNSSGCN